VTELAPIVALEVFAAALALFIAKTHGPRADAGTRRVVAAIARATGTFLAS
jgi:hypothetical protein